MTATYMSPLGEMRLSADGDGLTDLWFTGQKYASAPEDTAPEGAETIARTKQWLDIYFSGRDPGALLPLHMVGTPFRMAVWRLLTEIPYGKTTTYGALAALLAAQTGKRVAAQAVGGAVGHNRIAILVPCHRVIGADGSLTGYAGGLDKKQYLLKLEQE